MKITNRHLALLALTLSSIIWGAAAPIYKWSMQDIPPYTLAFLRFLLASLILLPLVYKKIAIKKEDFFKFLTLGFIGITLHIATFFIGLQMTASINTPIINSATPLFMMIGAVYYIHEKLKIKVIIGTLLSMVGILVIIIEPLLTTAPDGSILGNVLIFISVLCAIIYTLYLKKLALPYPTLTIVFWVFFLGALLFIPAFITEQVIYQPLAHMEFKAWIGILYGAIFSSAIAYCFYNFGVNYVNMSEIGIFTYIEPIITILVALPLLGEKVTPLYLIGSVIVFAGIFIAEAHKYRHLHHHLSKK